MLGIAVCSGSPAGHWVAPYGGRDGRLPTNPIAFAYPAGAGGPVVADFSTAAAPEGVIRSLRNRGLQAPTGWIRDVEGRPTIDPAAIYGSPGGAIQPLGGDLGYRGTALALLVEVLATLLAGEAVDDELRTGSNLAMVAVEPDAGFDDLAAGLSRYIRSSSPIDQSKPVLMPGDRERSARLGAPATIDIDAPTWVALESEAARAGMPGLTDVS
jgi:LDH2 family malate/lactate/ureidoglycolate dehydrogenase